MNLLGWVHAGNFKCKLNHGKAGQMCVWGMRGQEDLLCRS